MENRTITLDGTTYDIEQFSQGVQQAVAIYNGVNADLAKAQFEAIKSQAALQHLGSQIAEAVKKELAAAAEETKEKPVAVE